MTTAQLTPITQDSQHKTAIKQTFDSVASHYGKGGARFFHDAGTLMASLHTLSGYEHILDVASGTGASAIPLARRLPHGQVTAVDFSSSMLAQARARAEHEGLNNLQFILHDMTNLPFEEAQFDHANCAFGIFFVEDMTGLLTHIASKVKPGGDIVISGFCDNSFMPASELLFQRLRAYDIEVPEQPSWRRIAEPEQLDELFAKAGLKDMVITRRSIGYYTDTEGWWEVVWNAGFRGLVAQLGNRVEEFKREHFKELEDVMDEHGLWLEVDVNFAKGTKR